MSYIEVNKISYTYPVYEDTEEEIQSENKKKGASKTDIKPDPVPALKEISLNIKKGEFICILGRNGSGKSTLARHLNALLLPDEGTVIVDGISTSDEGLIWDIRKNVGMVFQNPDNQIVAALVEEDVAFGLENLGIPSDEIRSKVKETLESLDILEYSRRSPDDLSGGQKQRVAIAGILAMEPECIVLDEATSMLDPKSRREVMNIALKLNRENNITIVAITHYMDEALKADRVFVMDGGRITLEGTPEEVFRNTEKTEKAGLVPPVIMMLARKLRNAGMDIPENIIFAEELSGWLSNNL